MRIAIDFDDTFTADPVLWSDFIRRAETLGHDVVCVTARRNTQENLNHLNSVFHENMIDIKIYFCNLKSKYEEMKDKNLTIDIWIDDSPHAIVHGY